MSYAKSEHLRHISFRVSENEVLINIEEEDICIYYEILLIVPEICARKCANMNS
jgi:hypothetical protein